MACLRRRRGVEALIELVVALACAAHARCTRGHNAIAHRPAGTRAGEGRRQQRQGGSGAAGGTVAVAVGGHSEALRASSSTASRASARGVPRPPPHPLRARDRAAHRRCLGAVGQTRRLRGGILRDDTLHRAAFFPSQRAFRKPQHSQPRDARPPPLRPEPQHPPQLSPTSNSPTGSHTRHLPPQSPHAACRLPASTASVHSGLPGRSVGARRSWSERPSETHSYPVHFRMRVGGAMQEETVVVQLIKPF